MSVFEEIFQPEAADSRRSREAEKTLPVPAPPAGAPAIVTTDGSMIVIPSLGDSVRED